MKYSKSKRGNNSVKRLSKLNAILPYGNEEKGKVLKNPFENDGVTWTNFYDGWIEQKQFWDILTTKSAKLKILGGANIPPPNGVKCSHSQTA